MSIIQFTSHLARPRYSPCFLLVAILSSILTLSSCTKKSEEVEKAKAENTEQIENKKQIEDEAIKVEMKKSELRRQEEKRVAAESKMAEFRKANPQFESLDQLEEKKLTWPEPKNPAAGLSGYVDQLNKTIKEEGLVFEDLIWPSDEIKASSPVPIEMNEDQKQDLMSNYPEMAIIKPSDREPKDLLILQTLPQYEGPCSFTDVGIKTSLALTEIDSPYVKTRSKKGRSIWVKPRFGNAVFIFKKGTDDAVGKIPLLSESTFVFKVAEAGQKVYAKIDLGDRLRNLKGSEDNSYLILSISPKAMAFEKTPGLYEEMKNTARAKFNSEKSAYILENKEFRFQFNLDICT